MRPPRLLGGTNVSPHTQTTTMDTHYIAIYRSNAAQQDAAPATRTVPGSCGSRIRTRARHATARDGTRHVGPRRVCPRCGETATVGVGRGARRMWM